MHQLKIFSLSFALALYLGGGPVYAQFRHGGMGGMGGMGGRGGFSMPSTPGGSELGRGGRESGHFGKNSSDTEGLRNSSLTHGPKTADQLLTQDSKLASNLKGLLPTGTNLQDAAKGFDHLGQFVAAVHVSHNLNIPFDQLKAKMTDSSPESLGKAIHQLRPDVDARKEVLKANEQALDDMEKSSS